MVEKEEENALRRTAVVIRLEPCDERSSTANGALGTRFAQGDLMAGRGQRDVNALKAELELEGEAGTAELLIGMLAQEREDLIDFASHRKCSA